MNLQLLVNRIKSDPNSIIKPGKIVTEQEIRTDKYLISAYYHHNDSIRLVTPHHLIADTINGKQYPRVQRGIDITQYAYDFILQEGRALIFIQDGLDYAILMSLKDKRFLTFGDNRQIPFGISNFISPRLNEMGITDPYTYDKPILIVEGLRDCLDAQTIYPYTLAMQTAGIPSMVKEILSTLTHTLLLAFDNDESGQRATRKAQYLPFQTHVITYPSTIKDIGTLSELYFKDQYLYNTFKFSLQSQILLYL